MGESLKFEIYLCGFDSSSQKPIFSFRKFEYKDIMKRCGISGTCQQVCCVCDFVVCVILLCV
jgi:hypothetical protein